MKNNPMKRLCDLDELPNGKSVIRSIGRKSFLIYRDGDTIRATGHECPHHGQSLEEGFACDGTITCPLHFARFDLRTGASISPPALDEITIFETTVENGEVFIGRPASSGMQPFGEPCSDTSVIVIGGGAAGAACVETLRSVGFDGSISMISAEDEGPYDRTVLSKGFLAEAENQISIPLRDPEYYGAIGVDLVLGVTVHAIDRSRRRLTCSDGVDRSYDLLVIATGSGARTMPVTGNDVYTLRSWSDARRLSRSLDVATHLIIVGAGFVGLEAASALSRRGISSTIVAPEEIPFEWSLGAEVGAFLRKRHQDEGTEFRLGASVVRIESGNRVDLGDGSRIEADAVLVSIGARPMTDLLSDCGLCRPGELVWVDERMRTADARIYAIGDIALAPYRSIGSRLASEHWTTAMQHGRIAARSIGVSAASGRNSGSGVNGAAGFPVPDGPPFSVPFFWSDQAGVVLKGVGAVGSPDRVERSRTEEILVGYMRGESLVGAAAVGFHDELMEIDYALRTGDTDRALRVLSP